MERDEIKGFLLGISVGVGIGYYLLKASSGEAETQPRRVADRNGIDTTGETDPPTPA